MHSTAYKELTWTPEKVGLEKVAPLKYGCFGYLCEIPGGWLMLTLFRYLCSGWSLHVIAASFSVHVMKVASQHDRGLFLFSQTQNRFGKCMLLQMVFSVNEINPCMNPTTMAIIKITTLSAICPAQRILLVQKHLYETSTWMKKGFGWLRRRNLSACTTPEILDGNKHLP